MIHPIRITKIVYLETNPEKPASPQQDNEEDNWTTYIPWAPRMSVLIIFAHNAFEMTPPRSRLSMTALSTSVNTKRWMSSPLSLASIRIFGDLSKRQTVRFLLLVIVGSVWTFWISK